MTQALDTRREPRPPLTPADPPSAGPAHGAALEWIAVHALGVAAALFFVLPFVFVLLTSLMSDQQALTRDLWPHTWQWDNYATVWRHPGFLTWWRNTLIYAGLGTVLTCCRASRWRTRWPVPVPRPQPRADAGHLDDDAAAAGGDRADVPVVGQAAGPVRHAVAADHPDGVRRRVLDLPAAPVPADHPDRVPRRGEGRRLRRIPGAAAGRRCRWPSRPSPPSRCSSSSTAGTTTSARRSTPARTRAPGRSATAWSRSRAPTTPTGT